MGYHNEIHKLYDTIFPIDFYIFKQPKVDMNNLTIRTRFMINMLIVSLIACGTLSLVGSRFGKQAIEKEVENQLNLVRSAKQSQIEQYMEKIGRLVEITGQSQTVVDAAKNFSNAYIELSKDELNAECSKELSDYYAGFLDRLSANVDVAQDANLYIPKTTAGCHLQYEYLVDNPFPVGEKDQLDDALDLSTYSEYHKKYHPYFRSLLNKFKFYDIFLIDLRQGDIVYSVYKETDYATSLFSGPYQGSNLAHLARNIKNNPDIQTAQWIDFESYRPSYGAPASFVGVPLLEGATTVGALVFQLPVDEINKVMTGDGNWETDGLGKSGETYLVGEDYYMRSISRFFLEDTLGYTQALTNVGVEPEEVNLMYKFGTTIMQQRVKSEAVDEGLAGNTGYKIIKDYRQEEVASSYSPLKLEGLNWVILAEKDVSEAYAVVKAFNKRMFVMTVGLILLITLIALWLANRFVRPVETLSEGVREISQGNTEYRVDIDSKDEFGELAGSFNLMVADIDEKKKIVDLQSEENEALLLNFLPEDIALRVKNKEENIADKYTNVSLIAIDLVGFSQLTEIKGPQHSVVLLNELIEAFDDSAENNHIEKIRTVGDTYFAACGLFNARFDHAKRILQFAKDAQQLVDQFNLNHVEQLKVQIAINSGDVAAGIIGNHNFSFDIWGQTVNELFRMNELEINDMILISESTKNKLEEGLTCTPVQDPLRPDFKIFAINAALTKTRLS